MSRAVTALLLLATAATSADAQSYAARMADATMTRNPVVHKEWDYTAGVVLLGIHQLALRTGETRYADYVRRNMDALVLPDGHIRTYEMEEFNLDQIAQGRLLFALYEQTKQPRYRTAIETLREQLRRQPRTSEGGFWHKQIYPNQMWLDGLYMAGPFLAQYGKTFNDTTAFNEVAKQILMVARYTRDARTGLYYHAWDETRSQIWADSLTGQSRNFWGRALGWYAMAIVDVLDYLPETHQDREAILAILRDVTASVSAVQDPVTGLWYQVLDQPARKGNYLETSASAMFVYAFAKAARNRWIDERPARVARRGFEGLTRFMVSTDSAGLMSLDRIVQVSGLGGKQQRDGSFEYYLSEPIVSNDYKGVGPFILASMELEGPRP